MRPSPERLAKLPLFASLAADQLQGLAGFATLRQEPAGARIVEEGVPGFAMFVVEEGTALVRSGGHERLHEVMAERLERSAALHAS